MLLVSRYLWIAGQALLLSEDAEVGHGLVATSFGLENEPGSTAGGMVLYAGCQERLAGVADEDFNGAANDLAPGGGIVGAIDAEVDGEDDEPLPPLFAPAPRVQIPGRTQPDDVGRGPDRGQPTRRAPRRRSAAPPRSKAKWSERNTPPPKKSLSGP